MYKMYKNKKEWKVYKKRIYTIKLKIRFYGKTRS